MFGEGAAEARGSSLASGRDGLFGLPHHKKPARNGFGEGWSIYPPYPMGAPLSEEREPKGGRGRIKPWPGRAR